MPQPVVNQTEPRVFERRLDAAAAVMTADDNMLDLQNFDGKLHHRKTIHIRMNDQIGNVSMHEKLAGKQADARRRRNAAVRTTNPEIFRRCSWKVAQKIAGSCFDSFRPLFVVF